MTFNPYATLSSDSKANAIALPQTPKPARQRWQPIDSTLSELKKPALLFKRSPRPRRRSLNIMLAKLYLWLWQRCLNILIHCVSCLFRDAIRPKPIYYLSVTVSSSSPSTRLGEELLISPPSPSESPCGACDGQDPETF